MLKLVPGESENLCLLSQTKGKKMKFFQDLA